MSHATSAERNGNGTTAARQELVEALEAVLPPGESVLVQSAEPAEHSVRDSVRTAIAEVLTHGPEAFLEDHPQLDDGSVVELVEPKPEPRTPQGVIRVRMDRSCGPWHCLKQKHVIVRGIGIEAARAVAIDLNLRRMLNKRSTKWHAIAHCSDNTFAVVRVEVPRDWQAKSPTDWPCGAEVNVKAVRSIKERNRGLDTAEVDVVDWWVVASRLD